MLIANHGQIARLTIPPGWIERPSSGGGIQAQSLREFVPEKNPDVQLGLFYRGAPISEEAAKALRKVLGRIPHKLSGEEYDSLTEVLGNAAYPGAFDMRMAATQDLNGRKVIAVKGSWTAGNRDSYTLFVDADGSGRFVQQIFYSAPQDKYHLYIEAVYEAFHSLEWIR